MLAAGKASIAMARAALERFGERVSGGLVVAPAAANGLEPLTIVVGQHPQPGPGSEAAGRRALALAAAVQPPAELLVLISGGASSLLAVPADGLSLEDKRAATATLLRAGADIHALNTVRKHLSRIKGGRLAAVCTAASRTFVMSDVVGDDLSVIASGPTVADASTYADALRVIDRFGGRGRYPTAVTAYLEDGARGLHQESPKPGDPRLARAQTTLIGGRADAMRGAADEARRRGYTVTIVEEPIVGEARLAGPDLVRRALDHAHPRERVCVIASGETTVRVTGEGKGGRNQEVAISAAGALAHIDHAVVLASVGTDGVDGPTDAAGAIVDTATVRRAREAGLAPIATYLDANDSYTFFDALDDLVRTGPTGTNVGDLQVCLLA